MTICPHSQRLRQQRVHIVISQELGGHHICVVNDYANTSQHSKQMFVNFFAKMKILQNCFSLYVLYMRGLLEFFLPNKKVKSLVTLSLF